MKIILYSRPDIGISDKEITGIFASLAENGLDYMVNRAFAETICGRTGETLPEERLYDNMADAESKDAILVSYGGDGTFLEAVRHLNDTSIPVMGFNFGHLGFLANVPREEIRHAFRALREGRYTTQERSLLKVCGDFGDGPDCMHAFNEFVMQRNGASMISVEVAVNDEKLATYRGDGVLISTPSGSTAYSLSLGGPIVAPECACFVISPIAPHNLTMRPVVIPDSAVVRFRLETREPSAYVSLDYLSFQAGSGSEFTVTKGEKSIFLVNLQNISFYDTLRNKMMWGLDGREDRK